MLGASVELLLQGDEVTLQGSHRPAWLDDEEDGGWVWEPLSSLNLSPKKHIGHIGRSIKKASMLSHHHNVSSNR